jgi:NADPH:quinone reductase-like Zn-dependent oxidoreductase
MRAIGINKFGGREVLEILDLPIPTPGPGEILLHIVAAGVNPVDWKIREGLFKGRMPHQFPIILGWDAAGVVEKVGTGIASFKKGDEVFAYCRKDFLRDGSYAEYIVLESRHLAKKPKNLRFEEAAVIPLSGLTSYQILFEAIKLQAGETILIHAGGGGVGGYAIQMAKIAGAKVITTASPHHESYVRELGADEVIDYRKEDFRVPLKQKYPQGIDAVFDTVGGEIQKHSADVLKKGGRLASILALDTELFKERGIEAHYVFVRPDAIQLDKIRDWVEQGRLKVRLSATFPLEAAAKAHEMIEAGHSQGKIALII